MIKRAHIHMLEVWSVLLFSLLANFVYSLEIDFRAGVDYVACGRLVALIVSAATFYLTVNRMKRVEESAKQEYHAETQVADKARNSIDDRFSVLIKGDIGLLRGGSLVSLAMFALFFLLQPTCDLIENANGESEMALVGDVYRENTYSSDSMTGNGNGRVCRADTTGAMYYSHLFPDVVGTLQFADTTSK